jgi:hypothetical protein
MFIGRAFQILRTTCSGTGRYWCHAVPFESTFQALRHAIVRKALNPTVVNGMVFDWERIEEVLAIDDPMPTTRTPMGRRRPVVYFVRFGVELAGVHHPDSNVLARCRDRKLGVRKQHLSGMRQYGQVNSRERGAVDSVITSVTTVRLSFHQFSETVRPAGASRSSLISLMLNRGTML